MIISKNNDNYSYTCITFPLQCTDHYMHMYNFKKICRKFKLMVASLWVCNGSSFLTLAAEEVGHASRALHNLQSRFNCKDLDKDLCMKSEDLQAAKTAVIPR